MCSLYVAIILLGKKSHREREEPRERERERERRERERERERESETERERKEETVDEGSETDFFFDDSFHFPFLLPKVKKGKRGEGVK